MNFYKAYFFRMYHLVGKLGNYDLSFSVISFIVIFQMMNFIVLLPYPIVEHLLTLDELKLLAGALCIFLFIINYFLFVYKNKYLKILEKYEHESKTHKIISTVLTIFYCIGSLILFIMQL